jgi:hypothetical protein
MFPPPGFTLVQDVLPFDARWVLLPGLWFLCACALLLALRARTPAVLHGLRRLLGAAAVLLFLLAAWWTLGGLGAWRAGAGRLSNGTANFVEGTLLSLGPEGFEVSGQAFHRPWSAFLPALHASRWPAPPRGSAQVRLWFFGEDVLRLEAATP